MSNYARFYCTLPSISNATYIRQFIAIVVIFYQIPLVF